MADIKSINHNPAKGPDSAMLDQLRQQIGTEFTEKKMAGKKSRNELGKDDFMKLMSAQLKYQDPISPMKNEQMAAQLAQFSALEQMMNVNTNLEKMAASAKPQENMMAASLIGKRVLTDASGISYDGKHEPEIKFNLPKDASSVSISVLNSKGEVVKDIALESLKQGAQSVKWNGKAENGLDVPVGDYSYRVSALDDKKTPIDIKMSSSGVVTGVLFEGGKPMLLVGDKKLALSDVNKIEDASPVPAAAPASANANVLAAKPAEKNFTNSANSPSIDDENKPVKNTQKNLQAGTALEKMEEGTEQQDVAGDELGMSLWNPNNM